MLNKLQKLRAEREEGFTLIELLVVILIIGILSAIAIPAFMNQKNSAVDATIQADLSSVSKEIDTLVVKTGGLLKPIKVLTPAGNGVAVVTVGTVGVDPSANVTLSKGNIIEGTRVNETAGDTKIGYQLIGYNESSGGTFYWDSATGGAQW